jgi:hypothetical protein
METTFMTAVDALAGTSHASVRCIVCGKARA